MDNQIFGVHAVFEALSAGIRIERIYLSRESRSGRIRELLELAREQHVPVLTQERAALDRMSAGQVHQGVIAAAGAVSYVDFAAISAKSNKLIIVLDGVQDPHNLGAIIRTAEACRASGVIVPERQSAPLSATVAKSSAGALAHLPVARVTNLVSGLDRLKEEGFWTVGVDVSAKALWTGFDYKVPVALVLGGEHRGLRRLVREHCDALVCLPMLGKVGSLNVSVAAAVVLYEVVRQRQWSSPPGEVPG